MDIKNFSIKKISLYFKNIGQQEKKFRYIFGSFLQITGLSRLISFRFNDISIGFSKSSMALVLFMYGKEYLEESNRFISLIGQNDVIVDIGANIGFMSISAAKKCKKGHVIAVEPHPDTYNLLIENIEKNKLSNIKSFNLAIGEKNGEINFSNFSNDDQNQVIEAGENGLKVKMLTLDELLAPISKDQIAVLKIDVEGYEKFVLLGAKATLKHTMAVYIEIGDLNFAQFRYLSSDLINQLESEDFKVYNFIGDNELKCLRAPFIQDKCINVLALKDTASFCKKTGYIVVP